MRQLELNFEGGLTDRYETLLDCVEASVAGCGKQKKSIAMDLDIQPSTFSRMFSLDDSGVNFPLSKLPRLIEVTGDLAPIFWLVEKYCEGEDAKQKRALAEIPAALDRIQKLLKAVGQ